MFINLKQQLKELHFTLTKNDNPSAVNNLLKKHSKILENLSINNHAKPLSTGF
jgi:hypothetical protein